MRFLITATPDPDAPPSTEPPSNELFAAYMKFNEDLHRAGVLLASEGVNPAGQGAVVGVKNGKRVVLDGPYTETKELVGGFYLVNVKSREEAIAWALKCPTGFGADAILTIHPMTNGEDIPPELLKIAREVAPTWTATFEK